MLSLETRQVASNYTENWDWQAEKVFFSTQYSLRTVSCDLSQMNRDVKKAEEMLETNQDTQEP